MKINKRLTIVLISIVTIIFILFTVGMNLKSKPKYELSPVERKTIVQTVEASGTINAVNTVTIGSQVSGMIKNIYVDYNSKVKKGQLLAEIDPSLFQAQVDQARGSLNAAIANYQKTKSTLIYDEANYKRYKELYKKNYVSKNDLELALATYRVDSAALSANSANIQNTRATLQNNLTNLKYTKIISPIDGVVVSRAVDIGQTVAATFQTPTLFTVAQDLNKMQIEVSVSEADIGKVKMGQKAAYTLDGYPNEKFDGTVTQVRLASTTVSNVVTYTVVVGVDNKKSILKPGMSANVSIITNRKDNTLCVDNAAMRFTPKEITGGKKFDKQGIWVLRRNKPQRININSGITESDYTEVISEEIKDGDNVIIGSSDKSKNSKNSMPKPLGMF